jgi:hypothetical protein
MGVTKETGSSQLTDFFFRKPEDTQTVGSKQNAIQVNTFPPQKRQSKHIVFRVHDRQPERNGDVPNELLDVAVL